MVPPQVMVHPLLVSMKQLTGRHPLSLLPRQSLQLDTGLLILRPHRLKLLPLVLDLLRLKHKLELTITTMAILLTIPLSSLLPLLFHLMGSLLMILRNSLPPPIHNMDTILNMILRNNTLQHHQLKLMVLICQLRQFKTDSPPQMKRFM